MAIYTSAYTQPEIDKAVGIANGTNSNIFKAMCLSISASLGGNDKYSLTHQTWDDVLCDGNGYILAGINKSGELIIATP